MIASASLHPEFLRRLDVGGALLGCERGDQVIHLLAAGLSAMPFAFAPPEPLSPLDDERIDGMHGACHCATRTTAFFSSGVRLGHVVRLR